MTPLDEDKGDQDIYKNEYLELLYYLQDAIEQGRAEFDGHEYGLEDFCFRPITGEGCMITSPMGFWKMDYDQMVKDEDVKFTAQCIPRADQVGERICFDRIGVPVQVAAIFGATTCVKDDSVPCAPCRLDAGALEATFLLNNNDYSNPTAEEWEKQVFIRNVKTFNHIVGYQDELPDGVEDYNQDLLEKLRRVYQENPRMLPIKVDYLAERSIPDQIGEMASQNTLIVVLSYILMFLYVGIAIGYFPSLVHNRFLLAICGIFVVIASLIIGIGITLFFDIPLSMISSEVVPFLLLAIGVDNMFILVRAEKEVSSKVKTAEERIALALKEVGPSIFAAAFCESLAFFIGMLTKVPALESFCLVAALGVLADFVLQVTVFLAALTLDTQRIQENRADVLFCKRIQK